MKHPALNPSNYKLITIGDNKCFGHETKTSKAINIHVIPAATYYKLCMQQPSNKPNNVIRRMRKASHLDKKKYNIRTHKPYSSKYYWFFKPPEIMKLLTPHKSVFDDLKIYMDFIFQTKVEFMQRMADQSGINTEQLAQEARTSATSYEHFKGNPIEGTNARTII